MKRFHKWKAAAFAAAGAGAFCWAQNNIIVTTRIRCESENLPESFNGYRIAHISDLHNKKFGNKQEYLLEKIRDTNPDIIVLTGDIVDNTESGHAEIFADQVAAIAPVYYVPGNHEKRYGMLDYMKAMLERRGIHVLDNRYVTLSRDGACIMLMGIKDISFFGWEKEESMEGFERTLTAMAGETKEHFTILLSHRPEIITSYALAGVDLVFAGHAHGGQIRIPGIGGMAAPGQGFLPEYTSGIYTMGGTAMVVSRGLGNSAFPQRFLNPPEVVLTTLHCKS